jgi:hypothetical protein
VRRVDAWSCGWRGRQVGEEGGGNRRVADGVARMLRRISRVLLVTLEISGGYGVSRAAQAGGG